jgi:YidC/Oxa1 family membrane protein insertase
MYNYLNHKGVQGVSTDPIKLLDTIRSLEGSPIVTADALNEYCGNGDQVAAKIQEIFNNPLNLNIGDFSFSNTPNMIFADDWAHIGDPMIWLLLLVPILTFVVYFFSMRINRKLSFQPTQSADEKQQACSNTMMDIMMPLMSVWISFSVPAAIGVYWMFKSIIGVGKQFLLVKIMPLPKFTEEDYKAAEKELAGKRPKKVEKSENAGKVRSLHHIDDEDYDEHGNYNPVKKEEAVETTAEETNDSKMSEGVSMKGEDDKQQKKFSFRDLFKKKDKEESKEDGNENENKDEK